MASPNLPTNIDATYTDDLTNPSDKLHQQQHDAIHTIVNRFDLTATPTVGQIYQFNGTTFVPATFTDNSSVKSVQSTAPAIVCRTAAQGVPTAAQCAAAGYPDGCLITVDDA